MRRQQNIVSAREKSFSLLPPPTLSQSQQCVTISLADVRVIWKKKDKNGKRNLTYQKVVVNDDLWHLAPSLPFSLFLVLFSFCLSIYLNLNSEIKAI